MKTVLFDLDGTLLPISEEEFTKVYFKALTGALSSTGYGPEELVAGVWAGIRAMMKNDGSKMNDRAFWDEFTAVIGCKEEDVRPMCDTFYRNEFDRLKSVAGPAPHSAAVVRLLKEKGYKVALATNPVFPGVAVETRLSWIGLTPHDFDYFTCYENSGACKPSRVYYQGVLDALGDKAEDCLMVGNNVREDMCFEKFGGAVYLITDVIENPKGEAYDMYPQGSMADFMEYVKLLPSA